MTWHYAYCNLYIRLDYDLHSRILMSLAGVLADSRAKTSTDELERLLQKCPEISVIPMEDSTTRTTSEVSVGRMVRNTDNFLPQTTDIGFVA